MSLRSRRVHEDVGVCVLRMIVAAYQDAKGALGLYI